MLIAMIQSAFILNVIMLSVGMCIAITLSAVMLCSIITLRIKTLALPTICILANNAQLNVTIYSCNAERQFEECHFAGLLGLTLC